eukprot:CFRG7547T1
MNSKWTTMSRSFQKRSSALFLLFSIGCFLATCWYSLKHAQFQSVVNSRVVGIYEIKGPISGDYDGGERKNDNLILLPDNRTVYKAIPLVDGNDDANGAGLDVGQAMNDSIDHDQLENISCRYLYGKADGSKDVTFCNMTQSLDYTVGQWVKNCEAQSILRGNGTTLHDYAYSPIAIRKYEGMGGTMKSKSCAKLADRVNTVQYYWQPDSCSWLPFDGQHMRSVLEANKMLMVGDSLMGQFWESMQLLIGSDVPYHKSYILVNHKTLRPMSHDDVTACRALRSKVESKLREKEQVTEEPYEWMSEVENALWVDTCPSYSTKLYHRETTTLDWTYKLNDSKILVLLTGHHWRKEDRSLSVVFPKMIKHLVEYLEDRKYTGKIIVVTAPIGHEKCEQYHVPLTEAPAPVVTKYNWERISEVEHLWMDAFSTSPLMENFHILNVSFSYLRPDAHFGSGDCLHYCSAGVPDSWVHAMYNLLLQIL